MKTWLFAVLITVLVNWIFLSGVNSGVLLGTICGATAGAVGIKILSGRWPE